jgi:hypothetical protein
MLSDQDERRFLARIDDSAGFFACWAWTGAHIRSGYGHFYWRANKLLLVHRVAYTIFRGPIPAGLNVCHACDNPGCCNPAHLWAGTQQDNIDDQMGKGHHIHGETHHNARLSDAQASAIRTDTRKLREVAAEYGVSMAQVSRIRRGESRVYGLR